MSQKPTEIEASIGQGHDSELIPVVEGYPLRSEVKTVCGSIPVELLLDHFTIPYRDALQKTGYQRRPQTARITKFASALRAERVDVPTSLLLNLRGRKTGPFLRRESGKLYLAICDLPGKLHVVDGQHRVLAFKQLHSEDKGKWGAVKLQFVLMLGADENEEMEQFYTVNTTAKSVRTDLALDLLKHQADQDGRVLEEVIQRGQKWRVDGQSIVDALNQNSPIWRRKIRLANADKAESVIPAASFVISLRPLLVGSAFFAALSQEQQVRLLNAYWQGIREAMRPPFDEDPNDYALQKGVGVAAMHDLLVAVIEHVRSAGASVFDATAYEPIVNKVFSTIEGDNVDGEPVSGQEFWLSAKRGGAAGSYSSSAGKRVLFAKLRAALPDLEVE
ncbi:MAG: DGQHR domain-containing protein [Rhodobacteraceae bacterium]|nr:DGQHR domain-containing protein [Paracoccaceae bacterium]